MFFSARSRARNLIPAVSPAAIFACSRTSLPRTSRRWLASPRYVDRSFLRASYPLAEKLAETGVWKSHGGKTTAVDKEKEDAEKEEGTDESTEEEPPPPPKRKSRARKEKVAKAQGDKGRVNIVNEQLCDDVLKYIAPSLQRHRGCDIIDIYPGAGLWSQKLHDFLQPRSHILMEPDEALYKPFLAPLLEQPGTTLVPKSGIIWRELNSILTPEYLPHQKPIEDPFQPSTRNDTLLVTANIAFHPSKKFKAFDSIALLVFHQLIDSIRTSSLFQKYGQVRMLLWARHDDKSGILPKSMQRRRRSAIEAEMYCEWLYEVCGKDGPDSIWFVRDTHSDTYSAISAWERMREAKIRTPKGRQSTALTLAKPAAKKKVIIPGSRPPEFGRAFVDTLSELEMTHQTQLLAHDSEDYRTMKYYQWRKNSEERRHRKMFELRAELGAIAELYKSGKATPKRAKKLEEKWHESMKENTKGFIKEFATWNDNLHYILQDPPLMHWDRRPAEPLIVQDDEFFPNVECALLDIQPKNVHPLIRQTGPQSNRAGDVFELLLMALMVQSSSPVDRTLDAIWPGAAEFIMPRWKSIRDLKRGGVPPLESSFAQITPRMMNARQWEELLELWMQWPFRPEFHELFVRVQDTEDPNVDEGTVPNVMTPE